MPWPTTDPTGIVGSLLSENTQVTEVDFSFGQGMLSAWTPPRVCTSRPSRS
jgi:hypothetical protein